MPRHQSLVTELISLEQTRSPSGRSRCGALPGGHDDYATSLLGLSHFLFTGNTWGAGRASAIA